MCCCCPIGVAYAISTRKRRDEVDVSIESSSDDSREERVEVRVTEEIVDHHGGAPGHFQPQHGYTMGGPPVAAYGAQPGYGAQPPAYGAPPPAYGAPPP